MKRKKTIRQIRKEREKQKFNISKIVSYINDENKKLHKHICNMCNEYRFCKRNNNAIILSCEHFKPKGGKNDK